MWSLVFPPLFLVALVHSFECSPSEFAAHLPPGATVLQAVSVPENGTFGDGNADLEFPGYAIELPELCAVRVAVRSSAVSQYHFGLFLPTKWNERYIATGNGGFGGGINWQGLGTFTRYGFAAMSTDTGHNSSTVDATWAIHNLEAQIDWGYRALHGSVVISKQLADAFYGHTHKFAYYSGCSTGGRQGMKEVQMYPDDFDGVLAGAPAWWITHLQTWTVQAGLYNLPVDSPTHIPQSLMTGVIQQEILRQCDPQDGVRDNIISRPYSCEINFDTILCGQTDNTSACVTVAQIQTLNRLYTPWVDLNQTLIFPPFALGSEAQSGAIFVDQAPPSPLGTSSVGAFLYNESDWDWNNFSYATVQYADSLNPGNANANDSDISPFYKKGGKLISYHGYADGLIPTSSSLHLHQLYVESLVPQHINPDDFYRLFMVPGMQHCAHSVNDAPWVFGGQDQAIALNPTSYSVPGFMDADHDALLALMKWVEQGVAPEQIIATKFANDSATGAVVRQRPLCTYPKVAKLAQGNPDKAESWHCVSLY